MKKISMAFVVLLLLIGVFFLTLSQKERVAAQNNQGTQVYSEEQGQPEDIASEFEKAADTAGQQMEKFASQLEKIMDTIQRTVKNIGPQIKKMRDIIQEKTKQLQDQISEEFSTPSESEQ